MKQSIISFTQNGVLCAEKIAKLLGESECDLYTKCSNCRYEGKAARFVAQSIGEWAKEQFLRGNALVFIGACGIAVRAIAPHITDKLHDSPVLVVDERGRYVIPILSGHVGGANRIAVSLAEKMGAVPVITTATDIDKKFAVDLFAVRNGLAIVNRDGIAKVSSKALSGETITMSIEQGHLEKGANLPEGVELADYPPVWPVDVVVTSENGGFEASAITLRAKEYIIGVGCRKGKEAGEIEAFIAENLKKAGISIEQVAGIASVDVKKDEAGIVEWSRKMKIPFKVYTAEELGRMEGRFCGSDFVREKVGVDNVCERAALMMCGQNGRIIYGKHARDGMTVAVAKREWTVSFDEK